MKKIWKVLGGVIIAALVIGILCFAVGLLTGADFDRIVSVLDARYHIIMYIDYVKEVIGILAQELF